jgi:hypothetical protein
MPQIEIKKVRGLELQSNSFNVSEGSFERLRNCIVAQDDIIKKARGKKRIYEFAGTFGRSLAEYKSKLINFCSNRILVQTQNSAGEITSTTTLNTGGSDPVVAIASGTKARVVDSNGNLYFTTDNGIMKLETVTTKAINAGVSPATDLQYITLEGSASETYFRPDSQLAYRVVFGRRDANNNLVIGAPSQLLAVSNTINKNVATAIAGSTVTITAGSGHGVTMGDTIYVNNADGSGIPDGAYTVSSTTATDIVFTANSGSGVTQSNWGRYYNVKLDFAVPSDIATTEYIYQIYRSSASAADTITGDESTLQLIEERNLTSTEVSIGFVVYKDEIPDIIRGAYLYTNPNTGEPRGIAEANDEPPYAQDIALFKEHVFYANVQTPYNLSLSVVTSTSTTMPNDCELTLTGASTRTYIGKATPRVGNRTVRATTVGNVTTTVSITYNGHGFNNGDTIAVVEALNSSGDQLATLPQGNYTVANSSTNAFDITAPSTPTGLTTLSFTGISTAAGKRIFYVEQSSGSVSVATAIDTTARAIVRAINRDSSSAAFAYYVSSVNDIPGKMILRSKSTAQSFYMNAVTAAITESFSPTLPTSGQTVISTRDDGNGVLYFSKPGQPEAVPLANNLTVGSKGANILRIKPLRDSLIVIKSDGVYRVNGSDFSSFVVTLLDSTVVIKSGDSVATLNNTVYGAADQGIVSISETSAQIVSRQIEPLLTAIIGKSYFPAQSHAVAYESERLYMLSTVTPQATTTDTVYTYNQLTSGWSTLDSTFIDAYVKPSDDKLYFIDLNNNLYIERKNQNRLDYCNEDYPTTVLTTPTSTTATLSIVGGVAAVGDILVIDDIIHRITGITDVSGTLVYTFLREFSFAPAATGLLYKGITSELLTSPLNAGDGSRWKQYSEFQSSFRNGAACTAADIYFVTDSVGGSELTQWTAQVTGEGWGNAPWGQFPWGQEDGINAQYETNAAQILRTYVPLEASRATYIQAHIEHNRAAENLMMQSMAYTARVYGQRTTR